MDYTEKIKSKNWKERQEVYKELGIHFKEGRHLEILPLLQNEVNIPALETAIDSILQAPIISTNQVSKIFFQIGNSKTSIKNRIISLIENIKDSDIMISLLELLRNKNPKVVSNTIPCIINKSKNKESIILEDNTLDLVLNHPDKNVRSEGFKLAVELYKKMGSKIKPYLINIKPIIIKDLEGECGIKPDIIVDLERINDPKWNIRVEVLNQIYNSDTFTYNISILEDRINDPNNQVFFLVVEIIKKFKLKSQKLISGLIERLKDKKSNTTDKIKDVLIYMKLDQVPYSYFYSKSPELKGNLIEVCIKCNINDEELIKNIERCTEDSSGIVRSKAVEALRILEYDREILTIKTRNKLFNNKDSKSNVDSKNSSTNNINIKNSTNNTDSKNSSTNTKSNTDSKIYINIKNNTTNKKRRTSIGKLQVTVNKAILDSFYCKYPFLTEKTWSLRLEGIRDNLKYLEREDIVDLSHFIYSFKDPNFQINIQFIDLLLSRKKEIEFEEIIIHFCIEKCTEVKMRSKIIELLKSMDSSLVVEILVEEASNIKKGKKFVEIIKILENFIEICGVEEIFKIPVTGLNEKKGILELKKKRKDYKKTFLESNLTDNLGNNSICESSNQNLTDISFKSEIDYKSNITQSLNDKSVVENDIFSLMARNDVYAVFNLLPTLDIHTISESLVDFFIREDVQSTFFNSLMIHCITKKYILTKAECILLVKHYLNKGFYEEMSMIDRVYPITKLFLILKAELERGVGEECIINLMEKYINVKNRDEIKRNIFSSTDFLNLIDKVNNNKNEVQFNTTILTVDNKNNDEIKELYKDNEFDNKKEHTSINNKEEYTYIDNKKEGKSNNTRYIHKNCLPKKDSLIFCTNKRNKDDIMIAPSVYEEIDLDIDIETSLDCLNLSAVNRLTPNVKKFRKEFDSPMKNIENLEDILDNIIDSDQEKSEEAFRKLTEIIKKNINVVLFSANSIISSISIQLLDVLHRPLYAKIILNVLLRLSQSKIFCEQLRRETLESCNIDLINILKDEELSDTVSDILTNLCINSKMSIILDVYLNLINNKGDIPLKLIWRHSKSLDMKNHEEIQKMLIILEEFYKKSVYTEILENPTTFKIVILHIREVCVYYQEKMNKFILGKYVKKVVVKIFNNEEINISSIRN